MAYNPLDEINKAQNNLVDWNNPNPTGASFSTATSRGIPQPQESAWTAAERARLKAIEAQRKGTLKALQTAEQNQGTLYEQGKQSLSGQYQAGKRSLAEFLAQRGQTSSGVAAQGQIQGLSSLGMGLGQLESTRAEALANIDLQRSQAEQTALSQQAELAGVSEEKRAAQDLAAIQAGAYNQDVQAEINRRSAINPNDPMIPFLTAQRNQKLSGIAEAQAKQQQQDFENKLALRRLAQSGIKTTDSEGMSDVEYEQWAREKSTSGGKFNQDTYDTLMAFRTNPSSTIGGLPTETTPFYNESVNEEAQVKNFVTQFSGGRIGLSELNRQLQGLGYRYDSRTNSVIPM